MERELTGAIDIADREGRLCRDAVGWSRDPNHHRCNLPRDLARVHAFDYWCVTSRDAALMVLVADVGMAGVALVSLLDLASGATVERRYLRLRGLPVALPASPDGEVVLDTRRLYLVVGPRRIAARARTITGRRIDAELTIERPAVHESVNVLVPWDETRFHFTSKQQALPARGWARVDGRDYRFDPERDGYAARDFGRGRWPEGVDWCWAFAAGRCGDRTVGFNLGAGWTDGTGVTENGVVIDGRVHKISEAVGFAHHPRALRRPWRIRTASSERVDLTFTPRTVRAVTVPPVLRLRQCIGSFTGTVLDDHGAPVVLDDLVGLAETVRGRW